MTILDVEEMMSSFLSQQQSWAFNTHFKLKNPVALLVAFLIFSLLVFVYAFMFFSLFLNSFILVTFELHYALFFFAVWSVAHTTLAVPWPVVPDTVCPLTPPRCTPSPRPAAQGQGQSRGQGPAQRPVDRHAHSPVANSRWAWRRLMMIMMMMMPTALRDLPTFQSVGECVCDRASKRGHVWEHHQVCSYTTKTKKSLVSVHISSAS